MTTTVVALYDTLAEAQSALQELVDKGFNRDNISLAASDASGQYRRHLGHLHQASDEPRQAEDIAVDATIGAVVGGISGLLVGLGVLLIPGVGPIIAAGPLVAGMMSAGVGAITGGLIGALTDLGVPAEEADYYVEGVRRGGILLSAQIEDEVANQVKEIMNRHHPVDLNQRASQWRQEGWSPTPANVRGEMAGSTQQASSGKASYPSFINEALDDYARYDTRFHQHYRDNYPNSRYTYNDYSAAYQYGLDLANYNYYYGNRGWTEVEPEVQQSWEEKNPNTWEQFRDAIAYAWHETSRSLKLEDDFDTFEDNFRRHHINQYAQNGSAYEEYAPAYHYGYDLSHDARFQNQSWAEVEPEARRAWEEQYVGSWDQFKDAVRHAWEEVKETVAIR